MCEWDCVCQTHHADQFAFLDLCVGAVVSVVAPGHAILEAPCHPHHLDVETTGNLAKGKGWSVNSQCL